MYRIIKIETSPRFKKLRLIILSKSYRVLFKIFTVLRNNTIIYLLGKSSFIFSMAKKIYIKYLNLFYLTTPNYSYNLNFTVIFYKNFFPFFI